MAAEISTAEGGIADNILYFARALRKAGMRIGPASVKDAIEAVLVAGIGAREDFYWVLHSVLVMRREDHATFDRAFRLFWTSRDRLESMLGMLPPVAENRDEVKPRAAELRALQATKGFSGLVRDAAPEADARFTVSGEEALGRKDFAQMTASEFVEARQAIAALRLPLDLVATRRFRPHPRGSRADPRGTMRAALRTGGSLVVPKFRSRRQTHPPLVVLADISGSMSQYTRIFLHFLHALTENRRRVHAFVFGTRLTNLTRQMRRRDPDEALAEASRTVKDWSGGTRIGEALHQFNRLWSRRVLGQGAVVLLITDGLERDDATVLQQEIERLRRSCRRLIWLNPLLRFDGFEPRALGVRAMLPHVDEFRPVHNLDALADLCSALAGSSRDASPKAWMGLGKSTAAGP